MDVSVSVTQAMMAVGDDCLELLLHESDVASTGVRSGENRGNGRISSLIELSLVCRPYRQDAVPKAV